LREFRKLLRVEASKASATDSANGKQSTETNMARKKRKKTEAVARHNRYGDVLASMVDLLESARRA